MSENRQAIKPPKSLMFWRYSAASCAVVYGAVLGFFFVVQHIRQKRVDEALARQQPPAR